MDRSSDRRKSTELHATVKNLVVDLLEFVKDGLSTDAATVLDALTRLCLTNSGLQTSVGDAMVPHMPSIVSTLYDPVMSVSSISCLAACMHKNRLNQRRLLRHVPGLSITAPSNPNSSSGEVASLYVVCIPERLRLQWRQWKRRQRDLRGHRIPHGTPPAAEKGTPAPCYCNSCLGTYQLYPTWIRHFKSLAMWTLDDSATTTSVQGTPKSPVTSLGAYLQLVVSAHGHVRRHRVDCIVDMVDSSAPHEENDDACCVFSMGHEDNSPVTLDPLQNALAIQIFPDLIQGEALDTLHEPEASTTTLPQDRSDDDPDGDDLAADIVLVDATRSLVCCSLRQDLASIEPGPALPTRQHFEYRVQVAANVTLQHLVIRAVETKQTADSFVALVPAASLNLPASSPLALLQLSQETLQHLLDTCVVCRHSKSPCPSQSSRGESIRIVLTCDSATPVSPDPPQPIPGLGDQAVRRLEGLQQRVQLFQRSGHRDHGAFLQETTKSLRHLIDDCNRRVTILATAANFPSSTQNLRMAAQARCQRIRNDLVEAAKRVQLGEAADCLTHVHALLQRAVVASSTYAPWERWDPRVSALGLSNETWANGAPDAASAKLTSDTRRQQQATLHALTTALHQRRNPHLS